MFHENQRVSSKDAYFISGGNPDGNGGGVIATCNSLYIAQGIADRAKEHGYKAVSIKSYKELIGE